MRRESIAYNGIAENLKSSSLFRQIVLDGKFCLPIEKPDIEQITDVDVNAVIINTEMIKTPKGTSAEGIHLSGRSLVVHGEIKIKMQYVGDLPKQPMFTAVLSMPFITTIVMKQCTDSYMLNVKAFVEDIDLKQLDNRCLYMRSALYISAVNNCERGCVC